MHSPRRFGKTPSCQRWRPDGTDVRLQNIVTVSTHAYRRGVDEASSGETPRRCTRPCRAAPNLPRAQARRAREYPHAP
jgi:hypothetical protein